MNCTIIRATPKAFPTKVTGPNRRDTRASVTMMPRYTNAWVPSCWSDIYSKYWSTPIRINRYSRVKLKIVGTSKIWFNRKVLSSVIWKIKTSVNIANLCSRLSQGPSGMNWRMAFFILPIVYHSVVGLYPAQHHANE